MQKAVGIIFIAAWLLCGCAVETMFEDWRACVVAVVALIVTIVSAAVLAGSNDN